VSLEFLTPLGALIVLVALIPLVAFLGVSRRASHLRQALHLPELTAGRRLVPLVSLLALAAFLGLAASQPQLQHATTHHVRPDAEVFVVLDISRSMLAREGPGTPSRLERAKVAAAKLRASLPNIRVGIASLTNRVLPHLFPSTDEDVFKATLDRAIGIERPPPGTSVYPVLQQTLRNATSFSSLAALATQSFYSATDRHRVLVLLTDGESAGFATANVGRDLRRAGIDSVFVQFWAPKERVFTRGVPEPHYRPNPAARSLLNRLAAASGGSVYNESDLGAAVEKVRRDLGTGPTVAEASQRGRIPLAPYLAAAAFLPLTLLLWRRDR
jgi:hypothetical protein